MRCLPEAYHVAHCNRHHLRKFLGSAKGRREEYFTTVADSPAILRRTLRREPSERDVLSFVAWVLGKDRSFQPYVTEQGGAELALDAETWRQVLEAGAGAIVGDYLIALESGRVSKPLAAFSIGAAGALPQRQDLRSRRRRGR